MLIRWTQKTNGLFSHFEFFSLFYYQLSDGHSRDSMEFFSVLDIEIPSPFLYICLIYLSNTWTWRVKFASGYGWNQLNQANCQ